MSLGRLCIALLLALSLPCGAWAQSLSIGASLRSYFELYPELDAESKDLVLEVLDKGEKHKLPYKIYESLELIQASDSTLTIRTSPLSTWTLRLLSLPGGKPLLMTIETVEEPLVDSQLSFWSPEWQPLESQAFFTEPTAYDFTRDKAEDAELREYLRPLYCCYTMSDKGLLLLRLTTPTLLNDTTREAISKAITALPPLSYRWTGKQWQRF